MEWMTRVSWVDLLVIIIVLRSTYVGSQRGFFGELFHIFGICLVIIFSIHFYTPISNFLNQYLFIPLNIAYIIGFSIITLIVYLVFRAVYNLLWNVVKIEVFPAINKIGGSLLGFCKGFTVCIFLIFIMLLIPIHYVTQSVRAKSIFAPFFIKTGTVLYEKSLGIFSAVKTKELEQLLKGVEPLKFKELQFKRRDALDEILQ